MLCQKLMWLYPHWQRKCNQMQVNIHYGLGQCSNTMTVIMPDTLKLHKTNIMLKIVYNNHVAYSIKRSMSRQPCVNQRLFAIHVHSLTQVVLDNHTMHIKDGTWFVNRISNFTDVVEDDQELFFGEAIEVLGLV